jgi:hypothetical protein
MEGCGCSSALDLADNLCSRLGLGKRGWHQSPEVLTDFAVALAGDLFDASPIDNRDASALLSDQPRRLM